MNDTCARCGHPIRWEPPFGRHSGGIWFHVLPPPTELASKRDVRHWDHHAMPAEQLDIEGAT